MSCVPSLALYPYTRPGFSPLADASSFVDVSNHFITVMVIGDDDNDNDDDDDDGRRVFE